MSIDNILILVEQYKEAAQLIEAAQAEQEALKSKIRDALTERNVNYLEVGCHKIRLSDFPAHGWTAKLSRQLPQNFTSSTAKPLPASDLP